MTRRILYPAAYLAVAAAAMSIQVVGARQNAVQIDPDDIGGVVTSSKGPEAGVWVIAETKDLPTGFSRSVVTDDRGRYVIPDLPKANYQVFVRGYGLTDSDRVQAAPGKILNLTAKIAPSPKDAAQYYPANYWFAMLNIPAKSEFPIQEQGATAGASQAGYLKQLKTDGCVSCHQLGNRPTREINPENGKFESSEAAWAKRVTFGHDGGQMDQQLTALGRTRTLKMLSDWTDRIAKGEYPAEAPPRPQGLERNVVITQWDWSDPREYFHDVIASDKRNPLINPYGPVYGLHENSSDHLTILEPSKNAWHEETIPTNPAAAMSPRGGGPPTSPYWGNEVIWNTVVSGHSNEMDEKARVWNTTSTRTPNETPAYCKEGSDNPSAKAFPIAGGRGRQYTVYDPKTKKIEIVDTCFSTFHLNFAADANNTIWSGGGGLAGWVNTKVLDETHDPGKAQGWTELIVDTNGNGKRDAFVGQQDPVDPTKDKKIGGSFYAVMTSPLDGSVWGSVLGSPGALIRVAPGSNPPETALAEIYNVPADKGFSPRGADVDKNGVAWTVLSSGQLASFDRRKCKGPLNGPNAASGNACPEGWTFYAVPGPNFKGDVVSAAADSNYYNWSDKFNSLGLGENVQIATSNLGGALLALVDGKWVVLRVPYPLGFYAKSINGRIDDPKIGWKGRGLWTGWSNRNPWHNEGGKGKSSMAVHFQVRPDPLAK
jgi:Carboxypeptidase regulatory-like domain